MERDAAAGTNLEAEFDPGVPSCSRMRFPPSQRFSTFSDFEEEKDLEEDPEPENLPLKESVR